MSVHPRIRAVGVAWVIVETSDAILAGKAFDIETGPDEQRLRHYCHQWVDRQSLDPTLTIEQVVSMARQYLRDNPKDLHAFTVWRKRRQPA